MPELGTLVIFFTVRYSISSYLGRIYKSQILLLYLSGTLDKDI